MDRRGRAERDLSPVSADGLFPRYQGKTCVGTSPSGRAIAKLGGTAEVADFCPKGTIGMGPCGMKVFFFFSKGPQIRKEHNHDIRENPLQNLPDRRRDAHELVQCPGRYEDQARPSAEPRHRHAHGLR